VNADEALLTYVLRLADTALVIGQRMTERVAGEPELEEELATANFALDYLGQARMFYAYAGELEGEGRDEDDLAYLRDSQEFRNLLLAEQPNGHFGVSVVRQFLFESFYVLQLEALAQCRDERLKGIAARALKEIRYHLRHASNWLVRLGDGTEESHEKVALALADSWRFTGEFFDGDEVDDIIAREFAGPDLEALKGTWIDDVRAVLDEATLEEPGETFMALGGRDGLHTEHFGYLIAEMQHVKRGHPGATW
jgi:ring-1,2-phenylacetyl-CoA epoxidase subunit PaaC